MPVVNNTFSIRQLFNGRIFTIPDYQRGYSWEVSNVEDFLDDLDYLKPGRFHYTGTVVLHGRPDAPQVTDQFGVPLESADVVDGQQRLTTIVILLDCIRAELERMNGDDDPLAGGIQRDFVQTLNEYGQPAYRLTLNSGTNPFFRQAVIGDGTGLQGPQISSERRLERAKEHIAGHLRDWLSDSTAEQATDKLRELNAKVTNRLRFSLYEVEGQADVGVIFEVMNDRGKPLTELEKVKNYLLYASTSIDIPNELDAQVNRAWSRILGKLMTAGLEQSNHEDALLRAHWVIDQDPSPLKWKGIDSVKDRFNLRSEAIDPAQLLKDLERYIHGLEQTSIPFADAHSPTTTGAFATFDGEPELKRAVINWSAKLQRLGAMTIFIPILAAVRLVYPQDAAKYLGTLKLCENYAFRVFRLRGSRAAAGQAALFRAAHHLRNGEIDYDEAMARLRWELHYRCDDDAFQRAIDEHVASARWYGWNGLRYFLYEYEIDLAAKRRATPRMSWDDVTSMEQSVEHVLPQTIESVPYWSDRFDDETHDRYLHDLGNLTLTRYNASLSNRPFPDKKGDTGRERCYEKSPLFQEWELTEFDDWTPAIIDARRERLLTWARERWAIDLSDVTATNQADLADEEEEDMG